MSKDMVKRPDHYCFSKYEPKDVIREWGLNFNLGSAVKYIARAGRKDDIVQDLKKAREFLSFEIEALEVDKKELSKNPNPEADVKRKWEESSFRPFEVVELQIPYGASPEEVGKIVENALRGRIE